MQWCHVLTLFIEHPQRQHAARAERCIPSLNSVQPGVTPSPLHVPFPFVFFGLTHQSDGEAVNTSSKNETSGPSGLSSNKSINKSIAVSFSSSNGGISQKGIDCKPPQGGEGVSSFFASSSFHASRIDCNPPKGG
jgi:hypothetical protein